MPITFGQPGGSQITKNFDALFAQSLANYSKKMVDNVSTSLTLFYELKKRGLIETISGGLYIAEDLMYALGQFDAYDGYDELGDTPIDGITQVHYQWRQGAVPISYSMKEVKQNKQRLHSLVKSKIMQAEMGFKEGFIRAFLQGALSQSPGNSILNPFISPSNGALFIEPLPSLVSFDVTASREIGNLNQATYSWWRNQTRQSAATNYTSFLLEFDNMYNLCSRGPGGEPTLIWTDQTTYELLNAAYYFRYRTMAGNNGNYPFDNIKFRNATVVWDQYMPDVFSNSGAGLDNTNTWGTAYFLNPDFFRLKVEEDTNFTMTEFQKPPKGDSRLAHILFMGQTTINNRRKHGVIGRIPRTLTAS